ncbi:acyltransferase family protein [Variovorax paradoxus]|uniref:acyltransferase family protein n=1 Tax=Variovorax paradoxus TaxID=34073 RepID=UPI0019335EB0|nr:acyltransferase [Variovorax paradoxus]
MQSASSNPTSFRNDINGLRAWAVVAVILYHFGVPGFGGGFVGVDVFFVISGFLMTGIVVVGLERGNFSVLNFYLARARRILPALIALCAVLLLLGWWTLATLDYQILGTHAAFSLAFLSNIKFWREAGYFDAASHEKWLLHTWSLAVEWQFYLLLPLVLLAVWKWRPGRRPVLVAMVAGLVASLALSVVVTSLRPSAAFYLLPTRAWEMLAGGLAYLLANRWTLAARQRTALEAVGLTLVIVSIFGFDSSSPWPGALAMVPVIGTATMLLAAQPASRWTGCPLAQWLGTRSYSLYLWHWPIVVALTYLERQTEFIAIALGLSLTLALGELSYRLVETPARIFLGRFWKISGAAFLLGTFAAVAAIGIAIRSMPGIPGRFSEAIELVANESNNKNPRYNECYVRGGTESPSCIYGGNNLRAVLIGDSHADAVTTGLAAALTDDRDGIMAWAYSSCPTLLGVKQLKSNDGSNEKCGEFLLWAEEKLKDIRQDVPLVIVNRTSAYAVGNNEPWEKTRDQPLVYFKNPYNTITPESLAEFSQKLADTACQFSRNRLVYLVRPIPEMGIDVPKAMSRAMILGRYKEISISLEDYHQRHATVWAAQDSARDRCGVKILDPLPYLCKDGRCNGAKNGHPLYVDDDHLSEFGNKLLVPMFAEVFRTIDKPIQY